MVQNATEGSWSARNPIPKVNKFADHLRRRKHEKKQFERKIEREEQEEARRREQEKQEKQEPKVAQAGAQESHQREAGVDGRKREAEAGEEEEEVKPHPDIKPRRQYREVTDPTTGKEVEIDDVDKDFLKSVKNPMVGQKMYPNWSYTLKRADPRRQMSVPNANLGKETPVQTSPDQSLDEYKENQDITAPPDPIAAGTTSDVPIHGEKTNVLYHPTPSITYDAFFKHLEQRTYVLCGGCALAILIIGTLGGGSVKTLLLLTIGITSALWLWMMDLISRGRANEWSQERLRGEMATANLIPESVEWINSFMAMVWNIIDPEVFSNVADTIEDVMQTSIPKLIENVRVAEIDQGSNPLRILSMRALPDTHVKDLIKGGEEHAKNTKSQDGATAESEMGVFYNLEASFTYHAMPTGASSASKAKNMHMLLVFYLGVKGLFGVPLPVFVELIEFVGTVRLRLQMTPDPPFARSLTVSLMGLPHIKAGCTPMVKQGINILQLPVISNFVNYAIATAASLYVAPKSMSLDLRMLLQGDDILKDTDAFGVLWVRIHRARDLSKQDTRGSVGGGSDAYINLSFSKYEKPMYCTRVIIDDLNPVWEEAAALLVTPELIRADEQLSVELWDSDRSTADDIVGKITLPIKKMIEQPGKMFVVSSKLSGINEGSEMPGTLDWELGFFGKTHFRKSMMTDGKSHNLPKNLEKCPELQDDKGKMNSEEDYAVEHTPPDPLWPSGICSIILHQIVNLELEEIKGTYRHRKGHEYDPARNYGENKGESGGNLPTSYCLVLLNDTLIHRTRSKAVTSNPIFNTSMEHFIRDWRSATITIAVRDKRFRQHDPILGVVPLKLSEVLQKSSQATRWYPLDGGIGFGRIRISILFRSVDLKLAPSLLGWDVGTFQICSSRIYAHGYQDTGKLTLHTSGVTKGISRSYCHDMENGSGKCYMTTTGDDDDSLILPVQHRYRSAIVIELHGSTKGWSTIWLKDYPDNEVIDVDVPIWQAKMHARLTGNYITEDNCEQKRSPGLEDLKIIGRLKFQFRFAPGLHEVFRKQVQSNDSRETFETWEACISEGIRERKVTRELPQHLQKLYKDSLLQDRDMLRLASDEERRELFERAGIDPDEFMKGNLAAIETVQRRHSAASGVKEPEDASSQHLHEGESKQRDSDSQAKRDEQRNDIKCEADHGSGGDSVVGRQYRAEPGRPQIGGGGHQVGSEISRQSTNCIESEEFQSGSSESSGESSPKSAAQSEKHAKDENKRAKRAERRKHRGVMQWGPARNAAFFKNETKFGLQKVKSKITGGLQGREPDVETET
ncbi:hypothetical protein KEM54_003046 [Ascosphaera aggregata]|nr:hypothetical protein KEM54_003046 [Ascosphaera aggregata]